jgi:hypothetical protein
MTKTQNWVQASRLPAGGSILLLLALAACGSPPPREPVAGQEARKAMDAASVAYADCVNAAATAAIPQDVLPGTAAIAAVKGCQDARATLVKRVDDFHRIGSPTEPANVSEAVADQSVTAIEGELRNRAVTTIVSGRLASPDAKVPTEKAQ